MHRGHPRKAIHDTAFYWFGGLVPTLLLLANDGLGSNMSTQQNQNRKKRDRSLMAVGLAADVNALDQAGDLRVRKPGLMVHFSQVRSF